MGKNSRDRGGGGDAFVNMVYWPGEVIGKGENLAMVIGNVAEKVDRYRGMGLVVVMGDTNIDIRRDIRRDRDGAGSGYKRLAEAWKDWLAG